MDWIKLVLQFDTLDVYRCITGSCQLRRRDNWALCMYPSRVNKCIKGVLNLIFYQIKGGKVFRHFRKSSRFTFKCSQARVDKNHVEYWVERLIFLFVNCSPLKLKPILITDKCHISIENTTIARIDKRSEFISIWFLYIFLKNV